MKVIDIKNKKHYSEVKLSERELSDIIFHNWSLIFPSLELIQKEFSLSGEVRDKFTSGRIDFFAYNRESKSFVLIEIKSVYDKNIRSQILDYVDAIEDNFQFVLLKAKQTIPDILISKKSIEIVLLSKFFKSHDYERIKKIEYPTKLITYNFFDNYSIFLDQVDNMPQMKSNKISALPITNNNNNVNSDLVSFWKSFFELKNRLIVNQEEDYRVEGIELILRISSTHKKYLKDCLDKGIEYVTLNYLRKLLQESPEYIRHTKSTRFKSINSSAYIFNYSEIKKYQL